MQDHKDQEPPPMFRMSQALYRSAKDQLRRLERGVLNEREVSKYAAVISKEVCRLGVRPVEITLQRAAFTKQSGFEYTVVDVLDKTLYIRVKLKTPGSAESGA